MHVLEHDTSSACFVYSLTRKCRIRGMTSTQTAAVVCGELSPFSPAFAKYTLEEKHRLVFVEFQLLGDWTAAAEPSHRARESSICK